LRELSASLSLSLSLSLDVAVKFFRLAEALYYKMLEAIVERERLILGDADLSVRNARTRANPCCC